MIYIIRHGQTAMNKARVLQGRSDHPLDEVGRRQAAEVGKRLSGVAFTRVFSSPLVRAVETARLVAPGVEPALDARLIEMDYGPYEGADLLHPDAELRRFFSDFVHQPAPDGMEPLADIVARAGRFLKEIRSLSGDILVSTHAIAMKGLLEYLTPEAQGRYWSEYIGNCAVYAVENEGGKFGVPMEWKG